MAKQSRNGTSPKTRNTRYQNAKARYTRVSWPSLPVFQLNLHARLEYKVGLWEKDYKARCDT